jgi:LSD1 subclass zinc finger protein
MEELPLWPVCQQCNRPLTLTPGDVHLACAACAEPPARTMSEILQSIREMYASE